MCLISMFLSPQYCNIPDACMEGSLLYCGSLAQRTAKHVMLYIVVNHTKLQISLRKSEGKYYSEHMDNSV